VTSLNATAPIIFFAQTSFGTLSNGLMDMNTSFEKTFQSGHEFNMTGQDYRNFKRLSMYGTFVKLLINQAFFILNGDLPQDWQDHINKTFDPTTPSCGGYFFVTA
jgi:hypothetical protein